MDDSLADLTPSARHELDELVRIFGAGDADRARRWIAYNSRKTRQREKDVLLGLARTVAAGEPQGVEFLELVIGEAATPADVMCGRMATAICNGDEESVTALIEAWAAWPAESRADVLASFVWRLVDDASRYAPEHGPGAG